LSSSLFLKQLRMEDAGYRAARELELTKRVSRVEMDKWGKGMREETEKALLAARAAFEKRRDRGRSSTEPVAPSFTARSNEQPLPSNANPALRPALAQAFLPRPPPTGLA
jgi:hypothetical protein